MSAAAAHRPLVTVQSLSKEAAPTQLPLPSVFTAPIRSDIVHFVHTNLAKNKRQPYAVSPGAGHQHSAESWGTGRAVARIPRVSGGGTSRSGQGAFGNQCRKGRMFAPTKTWRRWHRKVNVNQKRYAVVSALAASAVPALVSARGHKIDAVAEIPFVVPNSVEGITKTKKAIETLQALNAYDDVQRAIDSKTNRQGKGKLRGRRHVMRRGPLIVYGNDAGIVKAVRNIPGIEVTNVERLNLLQLAPGAHLGRFIIWTQSAFEKLESIFGSTNVASQVKKGYRLPRPMITNADIQRIIKSDEIRSAIRPTRSFTPRPSHKKNPLRNLGVMIRINPYAAVTHRNAIKAQLKAKATREAAIEARRTKKPKAKNPNAKAQAASEATLEKNKKTNFARLNADE